MIKTKLFPQNGSLQRQIKFLLNYGILAPSGHNSQPWSFILSNHSVVIKPDFRYSRPSLDPSNRELYISLGAVATNISIAADYFGLIYDQKYLVDAATLQQSILFNFKFGRQIPKNQDLFAAITNRHTNRFPLQDRPITKDILKYISQPPFSNVKFTPVRLSSDKKCCQN